MEEGRNGKPKYRTRFVNEQGEAFNSLQELDEYAITKEINRNLYMFLVEKLSIKNTKDVFEFLVNNRKELITLLTCGNLETKYQGRALK